MSINVLYIGEKKNFLWNFCYSTIYINEEEIHLEKNVMRREKKYYVFR